jgi:hypothetical protein
MTEPKADKPKDDALVEVKRIMERLTRMPHKPHKPKSEGGPKTAPGVTRKAGKPR